MPVKIDIDLVKALKAKHQRLVDYRLESEAMWRELRKYVRPEAKPFYSDTHNAGSALRNQLFDGTAAWANEQLASAITGFLTPKSERWFYLTVEGMEEGLTALDHESLEWLEEVADIIYDYYNRPASNAATSMHELCLDLGSFGTGIEHQTWDSQTQSLVFRPIALADCWIDQDHLGRIDTLHRKVCWSKRQLAQAFGLDNLPKKIQKVKNDDEVFPIIHALFPRTDRLAGSLLPQNKKYASIWFFTDIKAEEAVVRNSGADEFLYSTPRFFKRANEVYGRGPGANCLPNIRYLQSLKKVNIKGKTKLIDPPLLIPHDGILTKVKAEPNSAIYFEADAFANQNRPPITPLQTGANPQVGDVELQSEQQFVLRCFYAEWIRRQEKKERQTATEIVDEKDERIMMMSPNLARVETELLDRRISRSYNLLKTHDKLRDAPAGLANQKLKVAYRSPATRAQKAQKTLNDRRFIELVLPMAEVEPRVRDKVDLVAFVENAGNNLSVSRGILRSPQKEKEAREAREAAQQQDQALGAALPASQAAKNLAQAQEAGLRVL